MSSVLETVQEWAARGDSIALATVVDTKKSAPQPVGTKMAVNGTAQICGVVSGGCVEGAVVEVAEQVLAGAPSQLVHYGIADDDAWEVGLPCGGEISVWIERYDAVGLQGSFTRLGFEGAHAALVTVVGGGAGRMLVLADGESAGTLGGADPQLDAAAEELAREAIWSGRRGVHQVGELQLFIDVVGPPPKLIMVGAVEFAAHLATIAALAGWRPFVVDPRTRFATVERFPDAERVIASWPAEAFDELGAIDPTTAVVVLTNDPKLDDAALLAALDTDAGYIGAMGSRRAQAKRRERLLAAGATDSQLERVAAPIGLDIGALSAAETAVSIMAEIIALRGGRTGGRLAASEGRIHDVAGV